MSFRIAVRLKGGLGNQLFEYCTAKSLSIRMNRALEIDAVSGFVWDKQYNRRFVLAWFGIDDPRATCWESCTFYDRLRRRILRTTSAYQKYKDRSYLVERKPAPDVRLLNTVWTRDVYLDGYWQSPRYFESYESEIIRLFDNRPKIIPDEVVAIRSRILGQRNSVAVHVRDFDCDTPAQTAGNRGKAESFNIKSTYYKDAVRILKSMAPGACFFVFTNNRTWAERVLPDGIGEYVSLSGFENSDLWEFDLMKSCAHFIDANSTFSWWASWLSRSHEKIVIVPDVILNGVMEWGNPAMFHPKWIRVPANV